MSERLLAAQVALVCMVDRIRNSERGQSSAEYAGIIVVVVALVLFLFGQANGWGGKISEAIGTQIDKLNK